MSTGKLERMGVEGDGQGRVEGKTRMETRATCCMQDKESHRRLTWIPSQGTPVANAKEARLVNKPRVRAVRRPSTRCPERRRGQYCQRDDSVSLARRRQYFLQHSVYLGIFPSLLSLVELTGALVYRGWVSCEVVARCAKKGTKGGGAPWRRQSRFSCLAPLPRTCEVIIRPFIISCSNVLNVALWETREIAWITKEDRQERKMNGQLKMEIIHSFMDNQYMRRFFLIAL